MRMFALLSAGLSATILALLAAPPAQAIPRTWVASNGSNANPCTRPAPCADFQTAHTSTDDGGEINCVDAGDFGSLTISKSITIDCTGIFAGMEPSFSSVFVNAPGSVVTLRGLSMHGGGIGGVGIDFFRGAVLHVENCRISSFRAAFICIPPCSGGIVFRPPAGVTATLYVSDSAIENNGLPTNGGGIIIEPAGSGSARVVLDRVEIENNTHGILADGTGSSGSIVVQVRDSLVTGSSGNGIAATTAAGAAATGIVVDGSSSVGNAGTGVLAQGAGALVHLGSSTVAGNGAGLGVTGGGQIHSYQNNQATGNAIDGAVTANLTVR
jgi:hypothetical protein